MATVALALYLAGLMRVGVDPAERTTPVTTAAFALVRNPFFTAMAATRRQP